MDAAFGSPTGGGSPAIDMGSPGSPVLGPAGGGAAPLQVTVNPQGCAWGFNPNNRAPTPSEKLAHDLCMMRQAQSAGDQLSIDLQAFIDAILTAGRWVLDQIENGLVSLFGPEVRAITDAIDRAYNWIANEVAAMGPWVLAAAGVAAYLYLGK